MEVCFDTNILIDAINGVGGASEELAGATLRTISIVTWIEVMVGCRDSREEDTARRLLSEFNVVSITHEIAAATVRNRKTVRLKLPDAIVLATAQVSGCQLSTRNTKDFLESDPTIRVPYRL